MTPQRVTAQRVTAQRVTAQRLPVNLPGRGHVHDFAR
jgi:hypothetical protein